MSTDLIAPTVDQVHPDQRCSSLVIHILRARGAPRRSRPVTIARLSASQAHAFAKHRGVSLREAVGADLSPLPAVLDLGVATQVAAAVAVHACQPCDMTHCAQAIAV